MCILMAQTLYLIRHAHPAAQDDRRRCISQTDLPLDEPGLFQSKRLAQWAETHPLRAIYASPLLRSRQTADILSEGKIPVFIDSRLTEMRVGAWENLPFDEIRMLYPDLYALRGQHMGTTASPGGESFVKASRRLADFLRALPECVGDVAIVSHGGTLRGWLCGALGVHPDDVLSIRQPWGGVTTVQREGSRFSISSVGCMPFPVPSDAEIKSLYALCDTPPDVRAHSQAVAACALHIAGQSGVPLDHGLLRAAALLHDMCRAVGREHPQKAAQKLDAAGYPLLADIVARHHDLGDAPSPEAEILYLADKLTQGTSPVPLEIRFSKSRAKCATPQALDAWQSRYTAALALERKYIHGQLL